ncbi:hypothetical protein Bca52824_011484 [Brassica carinata]|uniref:Zinc knuckle CX2CX4HX4C domain-containing protein n=1 Tax=Brassica carinata TaxID=52824 RepID=A0A8X7WET5_BRACI|nr:hypothetical protein Bca52824_011484 [Brassica carinata]
MDRWVEFPPPDYLQKASVWIRLLKLPVNYLTLKTIRAISHPIGYVKDIEFDPTKPHVYDYVRVKVIIDLQQPVRDTKSVNLAKGGSFTVDVEYERIRKKCFHCFRLSHEKQRCPILKGVKNKGLARMDKGKGVEITHVVHRKNHTDLVGTLMPLMSQLVPPGFVPRSVVAPEVFEEMHLYMNCTNPEERRIREFRMKEVLRVLSSNPGAQSSYLRLEKHSRISGVQNKELGRVFDFRTAETETERLLTEGVMTLNTTNEGGRVDIIDCSRNISDVLEANTTDHRVLMIWSSANIVLPTNVLQQSLEENVSFVFSAMEDSRNPQGVYRAIPWVMWMIWKKRNSLLYANTQDSIERLLQIMTEEVEQFLKYDAATSGSYGNYDGGGTQMWSCLVTRDHLGNVMHHARDALVHMSNRMVAELRCVIWALRNYHEVMEAITAPQQWPHEFESLTFECVKASSNGIARDIAKSVLRDGRYQSYLALGGIFWLHDRILRETVGSGV